MTDEDERKEEEKIMKKETEDAARLKKAAEDKALGKLKRYKVRKPK